MLHKVEEIYLSLQFSSQIELTSHSSNICFPKSLVFNLGISDMETFLSWVTQAADSNVKIPSHLMYWPLHLPYGITANFKRNMHTQHDECKSKSKHIPSFLKFSSPNSRCPGALKWIGLFPHGLPVSEQMICFYLIFTKGLLWDKHNPKNYICTIFQLILSTVLQSRYNYFYHWRVKTQEA